MRKIPSISISISMSFLRGYPWISMDIQKPGYPWISMDIHEHFKDLEHLVYNGHSRLVVTIMYGKHYVDVDY